MRVIYEISLDDMRNILAEKYEIDTEKIEFHGTGDYVFARIDVSNTETPEQIEYKHAIKEAAEDVAESNYRKITDELLEEYIKAGRTIPQICAVYKLTDSKYSARLYKRAEKFRSEDARRGNKEKAE